MRLLAGGNPQIAKADGDAPVQAYIAAMPGWKRDVGRRLDALTARTVPAVRKAVKWNSPMYGIEGQGWFLSFHPEARARTRVGSTSTRDDLDDAQITTWVRQAAALPGGSRSADREPRRPYSGAASNPGGDPNETQDYDPLRGAAIMKKVPPRPVRKPGKSKPKAGATGKPASRLIDQRIRDLGDWRVETLARMRALILQADPEMIEERKWRKPSNAMAGVPVWSHNGIVCTGEVYTKVVKLTFARGATIPDPARLFNSSLEGNTRRAIDIHEGEKVDAGAFKALVKAAVAQNCPPLKKR